MLLKGLFQNCACPKGWGGKLMVSMMNHGPHAALAKWGLEHIAVRPDASALDVGCGGGANVRRLLALAEHGHVTGVDVSEVSVAKSRSYNEGAIRHGRCEILLGDVSALPFENERFDVATAFETVYFWPGLERCFAEIYRVLRPGGVFLVANESTGEDEVVKTFAKVIEGMRPYTAAEIRDAMAHAGFIDIRAEVDEKKHCLAMVGKKAEENSLTGKGDRKDGRANESEL